MTLNPFRLAARLLGRRTPAGLPRRTQLMLERMEDRDVPTGVWTQLTNVPSGIGTMLLLPDGRVMAQQMEVSKEWYQLSPDQQGNYTGGSWSSLATMSTPRLYFGSNVLPSGKVFILGGEWTVPDGQDPTETNTGEMYDPAANTWSAVANFPENEFGDGSTAVLPNGMILASYRSGPQYPNGPQTFLYNPGTNSWSQTGTKLRSDWGSEESWVTLPGGDVLSYDISASSHDNKFEAQRYQVSTGTWVDASQQVGSVPLLSSPQNESEIGPAILLPDGRVFITGVTGNTAFFDTATNTWSAGPRLPTYGGQQLAAGDAPAAVLPNGNVLMALSPPVVGLTYPPPTRVYEFTPGTGTFTDVTPSDILLSNEHSFNTRMLVLPDGHVLFSDGGSEVWDYNPDGQANLAWAPTVSSVTSNGDGTYTLSGYQLTGLDEGAAYGDDAEMSSNYPLVRYTDAAGTVTYARTFNWPAGSVAATGLQTVQFTLPPGFDPTGKNIEVVVNGISSARPQPVAYTIGTDNSVNEVRLDDSGTPTAGPTPVAGTGPAQAIATTRDGSGHPLLFELGNDSRLYEMQFNGANAPTAGSFVVASGAQFLSISATRDGSGDPVVFALGLDKKLYEVSFDAAGHYTTFSQVSQMSGAQFLSISATRDGSGDLLVFALGLDKNLYEARFNSSGQYVTWGQVTQLSRAQFLSITTTQNVPGNPLVFALGLDEKLYEFQFSGFNQVGAGAQVQGLSNSQFLSISATQNASGNPLVFALGLDEKLYEFQFSGFNQVSAGAQVQGLSNSQFLSISATRDGSGNPVVFALGLDNMPYEFQFSGFNQVSAGGQILTENQFTSITAGRTASGNSLLFALGDDQTVYEMQFDSSGNPTTGFTQVSGSQFLSISATQVAYDRPVVFALGLDSELYEVQFDGSGQLTNAFLVSGAQYQSISATQDAYGHPVVFALGLDSELYEVQFDGSGQLTNAFLVSGAQYQSISATQDAYGHLVVFALGLDSELYEVQFDGSGQAINGFQVLTNQFKSIAAGQDASGNPILFAQGLDDTVFEVKFDPTGDQYTSFVQLPALGTVQALEVG